jgi:hypothetical protein
MTVMVMVMVIVMVICGGSGDEPVENKTSEFFYEL